MLIITIVSILFCACNKNEDTFTRIDGKNGYRLQEVTLPDDDSYHNEIIMVTRDSNNNYALELSYLSDSEHPDDHLTLYTFDDNGNVVNNLRIDADIQDNCHAAIIQNDGIIVPLSSGEIAFVDSDTGKIVKTSDIGNTDYVMDLVSVADNYVIVRQGIISLVDKEFNLIKEVSDNRITYLDNNAFFEEDNNYYIGLYDGYYSVDFEKCDLQKVIDYEILPLTNPSPCGNYIISNEGLFDINIGRASLNTLADFNYINIRPGKGACDPYYYCLDHYHFAKSYNYSHGKAELDLYIYDNTIDYSQTKQIIIGGYGVRNDELLNQIVYKFNTSHDDYRIFIDDYSVNYGYENAQEAQTALLKLMQHFSEGYAPDIYYGEGFDYTYFGKQGLVCDLSGYLKERNITSRLYPSITRIINDNEECYSLFAAFTMDGYWGLQSRFSSEGVTLEDIIATSEDTGIKPVRPSFAYDLMDSSIRYPLELYISRRTNENVLDIADLNEIIDYSTTYGVGTSDEMMNAEYMSLLNGDVLLERAMISNIYGYYNYSNADDHIALSFLGFPAIRGSVHGIRATGLCAISESSEYKDICFEILSSLFDDEIQEIAVSNGLTPVCSSAFDKMIRYTENQEQISVEGNKRDSKQLSKQVIDEYIHAIDQIDSLMTFDWGVFNIIYDETMSFYSQNKSSDEIARSLQSRLNVYVDENYG